MDSANANATVRIAPDMTDPGRCISVHWALPTQCVLRAAHRENWHEAWHPETGNQLRYRYGAYATEELRGDTWHDLGIPGPDNRSREQLAAQVDALTAQLAKYGDKEGCLMGSWDLFADVRDITAWLDASNPDTAHEDSMRVLKLVEESGEAAAAYIGMVGQNPRKGVTHSLDDLLSEIADVALTALCAMQHFTKDAETTRKVLAGKVERIITRANIRTAREVEVFGG